MYAIKVDSEPDMRKLSYQHHSLGGSFTSVIMYPDRCRPLAPEVVGQMMLGVPSRPTRF